MTWHRVEFTGDIAALSASDFVRQLGQVFRAARLRPDAKVYHGVSTAGDHVY
jgi:hypothetical protein